MADSIEILPDSLPFGQVSDYDFYVAYDPTTGDDTALSCALYLGKVAALATVSASDGESIDVASIQREVGAIRSQLEEFAKIEACHTKIDANVTAARAAAAHLKTDILAALRRLDALLAA